MTIHTEGHRIIHRYRPLVDAEIRCLLASQDVSSLFEMVRYHVGYVQQEDGNQPQFAGKRVRAAICFLCCEAAGGEAALAAPAATAIELLHSFTLLHDDIADQDEMRRGRETVWRRWGVGQAITAGDALFALANLAVSRHPELSADAARCVTRELNEATLLVCEGQELDLSYEGRTDVGVDDYLAMVELKTAALLASAAAVGADIAEAPDREREGLRTFGHHLGMAYQIRDDLLGIWGDPAELGKPVGSDLRRNKRSLPIIHALSTGAAEQRSAFAARLSRGIATDAEATTAAAEMERLGSRAFCEQMAQDFLARALDALSELKLCEGPAGDLRALAGYLMERTE